MRGDVRDMELMRSLLADAVIPLACLAGAPVCEQKPLKARSINLDAVKALLDMSSRNQAFILPITNSGYSIGEAGMICTETSPRCMAA